MAKTKKNPRILEECEDFLWSEWRDLNPRPLGPEPSALPAALHPDKFVAMPEQVVVKNFCNE